MSPTVNPCIPLDWAPFYQLRQGDPHGGKNCAAYSLAAGLRFDSCGATRVTGRSVRALSSEPVPDPKSPGLTHEQLAEVAAKFGVTLAVHRGMPWDEVDQARDEGYGVLLAINYAPVRTTPYAGQLNFTGNHELLLLPGLDFDPLADGRLLPGGHHAFKGPGQYPELLLRQAAGDLVLKVSSDGTVLKRLGQGRAYAAIFPHPHLATPVAVPIPQPVVVSSAPTPAERNLMITTTVAPHLFRLAKGQPLYRHPGGPIVTRLSAAGSVAWVGGAGAGWTAVRVSTGAPYADKKQRPTIVYVPTAAGIRV